MGDTVEWQCTPRKDFTKLAKVSNELYAILTASSGFSILQEFDVDSTQIIEKPKGFRQGCPRATSPQQ